MGPGAHGHDHPGGPGWHGDPAWHGGPGWHGGHGWPGGPGFDGIPGWWEWWPLLPTLALAALVMTGVVLLSQRGAALQGGSEARRHGVEVSAFAVSFLRFGAERLLTVRREFPPRDAHTPDPAAEVHQLLGDAVPSVGVVTTAPDAGDHSTPPPGA